MVFSEGNLITPFPLGSPIIFSFLSTNSKVPFPKKETFPCAIKTFFKVVKRILISSWASLNSRILPLFPYILK